MVWRVAGDRGTDLGMPSGRGKQKGQMHGIEFPSGGCEETVHSGLEDHRKRELRFLRTGRGG